MANYECARCHRYFDKVAFEEVCPICFPVEEEEFRRIKELLTVQPGATASEIMQELGVSLKSIKRYLKEDRLEIVGDNKGFIACELCGQPLNSGRFCNECYKVGHSLRLKAMEKGGESAYQEMKQEAQKYRKTSLSYKESMDN
ncbi:MAG: MerR family transcriptional regulator [Acetivibrionales bacterium]|jgi:predicted transcriptional regulator|nr:MerR family transcriptional regulator [Clostridiaceae bacterium]